MTSSPWHYEGPSDVWVGGPEYLAMQGNVGVIECYSAPPFGPRGARAAGERGFRGDVWIDGGGSARIEAWSPNRMVIAVRGASAGPDVVYNGNAAPGWSALVDGRRQALSTRLHDGALATALPAGDATVEFTYRPPGMRAGLLLAAMTLATIVGAEALRRRMSLAAGGARPARDGTAGS
ncbi:MAG: YfhO family protein [Deltaproteobacteria bacterium]